MIDIPLPFLTDAAPPIRAIFKKRNEDFEVIEIPAYEPCGKGDHVYFEVEKNGRTTQQAVREIASALKISPGAIGYAGLKDAHAVTRQLFSIEHIRPEAVSALAFSNMRILRVTRHRNKLKTGHLKGNRFVIRLREVDMARIGEIQEMLATLEKKGVPNYFGAQRFGNRGDTWQVGRAVIQKNFAEAVALIAGRADDRDEGPVHIARALFDRGEYRDAARAWPHGYGENAALCRAVERFPEDPRRALMTLDRRMLSLFVSAFQSHLFNQVVADRIHRLDQVETGDLAWKHDKGVIFPVEDGAVEQPRALAGEISPSGPMFGDRMKRATGRPGEFEDALLAGESLTVADFPSNGVFQCAGGRRPLRFFPKNCRAVAEEDAHGSCATLSFELESGCYATVVLREICKDALVEG